MEFKEIKKKSESDLHKLLADSRDKLRDIRFKDANKQLKNVRELRKIRTVISRVLTLLNVNKKENKKTKKQKNNVSISSGTDKKKDSVVKTDDKKSTKK